MENIRRELLDKRGAVLNCLLLLLITGVFYSCGQAGDAVKPKDNGRFGSTTVTDDTVTATPPSFTTISSTAIAKNEGENYTSSILACTTNESGIIAFPSFTLTQTNSYAGCIIQNVANVAKVICDIDYAPGHDQWKSTVFVHCSINDLTTTQSFLLDIADTNQLPVLDAIGNQSVYVENAISPIDAADTSDDLDLDAEIITYTCTYATSGTAAGTACSSLPSDTYSFNTDSGVLVWTPSLAAGTADGSDVDYDFTITGSDPAAGSDTEGFTVTIQNIAPPTYTSTAPESPSTASSNPKITGTVGSNNNIYFYTDPSCLNYITSGNEADFEGSGITLSVNTNSTTSIYAVAQDTSGHKSACTYMTDYTHDNLSPDDPTFVATNPASPSNSSVTPKVIGNSSLDTVTVDLYSDASCTASLGSGSKADFEGTGITTSTLTGNGSSAIYGRSTDNASLTSNCVLLVNYVHDDIDPTDVTGVLDEVDFTTATGNTPNIAWNASTDSGSGLSHYQISVGTTPGNNGTIDWTNVGNVTSTIRPGTFADNTTYYANVRAIDYAGNISVVGSSDGWTVDTTGAPSDPTFVSTDPASPSNSDQTPAVIGGSSSDTTTVTLYSDSSCTASLGSGTKAEFEGAGITTSTLSANAQSPIYAKAVDASSRESGCVLMTNYRHDNTAPSTTTIADNTVYNMSLSATPTLNWSAATDTGGSGVSYYEVSVGTTAGTSGTVDWVSVGNTTNTIQGGTFVNGQTYYANIRVTDSAGNVSNVTSSDGWTIDTSSPTGLTIDSIACLGTGTFSGSWTNGVDSESGIDTTEYSIGTTDGDSDLVGWTDASGSTSSSNTGLTLVTSTTYYFNMRTTNNAGLTSSTSLSAQCSDLNDQISAFWTFNETPDFDDLADVTIGGNPYTLDAGAPPTAIISQDSSSSNNPLQLGDSSSSPTIVNGKISKALVFDGANDFLTPLFDDESDLMWSGITPGFTISLWVKMDSASVGTDQTILSKRMSNSSQNGYLVGFDASINAFYFMLDSTDTIKSQIVSGFAADTWYHIAVWYDDVNYRYGIAVNSSSSMTNEGPWPYSTYGATAAEFQVGTSNRPSDPNDFHGTIDAIGFWQRVLSDGEKTLLYSNGNGLEPPF
ncbi:MAG: LamG domain-containing protein [Bdellovibrionales bacterium]|nr:LamG domain-containing protein [Bdellovibrionales bacterium]MBT3526248.1 LamG domain-containing protein [Bdellovibrionales bacterium]